MKIKDNIDAGLDIKIIVAIMAVIVITASAVWYYSENDRNDDNDDINDDLGNNTSGSTDYLNFTGNYVELVKYGGLSFDTSRLVVFENGSYYYFDYYPNEMWFNVTEEYNNISKEESQCLYDYLNISNEDYDDYIVYHSQKGILTNASLLDSMFNNQSLIQEFCLLNDTYRVFEITDGGSRAIHVKIDNYEHYVSTNSVSYDSEVFIEYMELLMEADPN